MFAMMDLGSYYDVSTAMDPTVAAVTTVISIASSVLMIVCMWKLFLKAGKPGWAAIIPFYNLYILFEIIYNNGVKFLFLLIPIYNIIVAIGLPFKTARCYGKSAGFGAGLLLLPVVFYPILAFGSATYQGPIVK